MLTPFFVLGSTFFGLTLEYKNVIDTETYYLVKHLGFTNADVQCMPVYKRKVMLNHYINELEKQAEDMKKTTKRHG